jgi:hypothetical protein
MDIGLIRINHGSIPTFDRSIDKYAMWWTKFRTFAKLNGFGDAIDPNLPDKWNNVIDASTESGKKQLLPRRRTTLPFQALQWHLQEKDKTKEWPEGVLQR